MLIGIPISIQRKSYKPFAILGVLGTYRIHEHSQLKHIHGLAADVRIFCLSHYCIGSFVDYSVPYTNDCRLIHNAMQLALQQERQRDAAATKTLSFGDDAKE